MGFGTAVVKGWSVTQIIGVIILKLPKIVDTKPMFGCLFLVTQFPPLITLKYHVCLAPSLTSHHSIFFILFVGPIPVTPHNLIPIKLLNVNFFKKEAYN